MRELSHAETAREIACGLTPLCDHSFREMHSTLNEHNSACDRLTAAITTALEKAVTDERERSASLFDEWQFLALVFLLAFWIGATV